MIPTSARQIAELVGGTLHDAPDPEIMVDRPTVIDSRLAEPGSLFAALPGEHTDGHLHAEAAVARGAVAVLAARPVGVPAVVVPDVQRALGDLALAVVNELKDTTVIGVTGSAGKTGTKDLLAQVLASRAETVANPLSFNNEIGLPLTVLTADERTRFLVTEMGARGLGQIAYLAGIARPSVGVVTNVGSAHLGEFGSREATCVGKGELVEALPDDGTAVLNADDPAVMTMARRTAATVLTFGHGRGDVQVHGMELDAEARPSFELSYAGERERVSLALHGAHQATNAAAAAAAALAAGLELQDVARALKEARRLTPSRMQITRTPGGVTVVNDAFNANPEAMGVALDALMTLTGPGQRSIAVLGEMRELGPDSERFHHRLGERVAAAGVTDLIAVGGRDAAALYEAAVTAGINASLVPDRNAALDLFRGYLLPGDVVLIKGSHATKVESVATALLELGDAGRGAP
ncbi:UDP-N-acetylmuramoyl-tripeptide--D-alanyl-D-alanine ligase [Streptomyces sp. NPDC051954]|uniref:UDP-N-acetylmuramoyl-tripeptide--D-alanyl-D- alanine ligase n=1 Tax=unclassified Streptomyces TaxID=2593676 RepID=UPI0034352F9D